MSNTSRLLGEVERQKKYIGQLPENFTFPLFNSKKALESQPRTGTATLLQRHAKSLLTQSRRAPRESHFDHEDGDFIGKFGFGLPTASINQTRRVEVYTRTAPAEPIMMAFLDIDKL